SYSAPIEVVRTMDSDNQSLYEYYYLLARSRVGRSSVYSKKGRRQSVPDCPACPGMNTSTSSRVQKASMGFTWWESRGTRAVDWRTLGLGSGLALVLLAGGYVLVPSIASSGSRLALLNPVHTV